MQRYNVKMNTKLHLLRISTVVKVKPEWRKKKPQCNGSWAEDDRRLGACECLMQ